MWFDRLSEIATRRRQYGNDSIEDTFNAVVRGRVHLGCEQTPHDIARAALYLTRADKVTGIWRTVANGFVMN